MGFVVRMVLLLAVGLASLSWYAPAAKAQDVRIRTLVTVRLCDGSLSGVTDPNTATNQCTMPGTGLSLKGAFRAAGRQDRVNFAGTTDGNGMLNFPEQNQMGEIILFTANSLPDRPANWVAASSSDDAGNPISGLVTRDYGTESSALVFITSQPFENISITLYLYNPSATLPKPTGNLAIYTWSCDGNPHSVSKDQWLGFCTQVVANLTVIITAGEKDLTTATDVNGNVRLAVEPATYNLQVPIPVAFNDGELYCQEVDAGNNLVGNPSSLPLGYTGGRGSVQVSASGNTATCWFLFFSSVDGTLNPGNPGINGQALLCDPDFSDLVPSTDANKAIETGCPLVASTIQIQAVDSSGTTLQTTTGPDGSFELTSLGAGTYRITADGPSFNDGLNAFCVTISGGSASFEKSFPDTGNLGTVSIELPAATDVVRCRLLLYNSRGDKPGAVNTPSDKAEIRVQARLCPDGFASTNFDQLDATCKLSPGPVVFTADGETTIDASSTGESSAVFANLSPGEWTLFEIAPDGFAGSLVFCTVNSNGALGENLQKPVTEAPSITQTLNAGDLMLCSWFNTTHPIDPEMTGDNADPTNETQNTDTATLIIVLRMCPEDYNPDAAKSDPATDCTELVDNVNISATSVDVKKRRQTGETDPGTATYSGLPSGIYRLHEGYPPGVQSGFVLSCESDQRVFEYPYIPFARIDATGSIKVELQAPETMTCLWFNVPTSADQSAEEEPRAGDASQDPVDVRLRASVCPSEPNPATCRPVDGEVEVTFVPSSLPAMSIKTTLDEDGRGSLDLKPGAYRLSTDPQVCIVRSAARDEDGRIVIQAGKPVSIELFLCD